MKTILRSAPHPLRPHETVFEVWHDGQFIASITGTVGPGVRVTSKHTLDVRPAPVAPPNVAEVAIGDPGEPMILIADESDPFNCPMVCGRAEGSKQIISTTIQTNPVL